ncbi:MAG: iron-sulfur cluster biosynthesis family protein [Acidobacteriota bacterium]|nr:iron-sulfur cluster biosynthesis family protein [Acidobacteriota bacterium]MDQ5872779.1 iron-sulfur cluster biosynthesis family protein [Acidobacteriota bacterium]
MSRRSEEATEPAAVPLTITAEAAERLSSQADFSRSVLLVRHLLGCGGNGFRVSVEANAPDEGHRFESSGIPVVMDDYAFATLQGAVLTLDPDPTGDGYRLEHPNAPIATFC